MIYACDEFRPSRYTREMGNNSQCNTSIKILYKIYKTEPKTATVLVRDIEQYIKILSLGTVCGYCCYGFIKHMIE